MKIKNLTLKGIVLGVLLSIGVSSASASENIRINNYWNTELSVVSIINPTESAIKMRIYDIDGEVLYSEQIENSSLHQKLFDFSNLEDGSYKIEIRGKKIRTEKVFEVEDHKLAVASSQPKTEKTLFRAQDDALYLTYFSLKSKDFNLSIADASGNQIFTNNYSTDPTFFKKFDISALPKGEYKVRVESDNKAYNYAFQK